MQTSTGGHRQRQVRDALETALGRIADPVGEGARAFTRVYAEEARSAADAADARASFGQTLGPLDGRIVSVKDLFDVRGEATTGGDSSGVASSVALTRTGVGTVPEFTRAVNRPLASESCTSCSLRLVAERVAPCMVMPPASVCSSSNTGKLDNTLPVPSRTSNVTVELSVKPEPLM